jgi:hypothetical protein
MKFRLVDTGWAAHLEDALRVDHSRIRVIAPFIKERAAERLLKAGRPETLEVITRFNLDDFSDGVSDIAALRLLMKSGARIRGIKNLHAKLYLFGDRRAIVTSANLTEAALLRNHEFGFLAEDEAIIARCREYFNNLWKRATTDLTDERIERWHRIVTRHQAQGAPAAKRVALGDEGVDAGLAPTAIAIEPRIVEAGQAFVKFFGEGHNRAERSGAVLDEVAGAGCHWACTYPRGKRPRQVRDGAVMFMAHLVKQPNDVLIFGRAIGMEHRESHDDASAADLELRPWKADWPHYIRVHHAEFVAGNLSNGVSLNELTDALGVDSFASTQRNAAAGIGNTNPRSSLRQQAAVELSPQGGAWLSERLEQAFVLHGKLPADELAKLDWPDAVVDPGLLP